MFYSIKESMNVKIVGKYFQSENIAYNYGDDPKFLNNVYFEKIDFTPITPVLILHKKAKITDLISNVNGGSGTHLVMSEKLKNIIEKYRKEGLQFFKTSIIKDKMEIDNYFSLNMYIGNNGFIDFSKSTIKFRRYDPKIIKSPEIIKVNSLIEFNELLENRNMFDEVSINNIFLNDKVDEDFFMLRNVFGSLFFVSEKLKQEIEDAGCTGIEFQPTELSYQEWSAPGGERERVYGKF